MMSASTAASSASSPRALTSMVRRRARTLGSATTKIFTSAWGQITVPMSRPSSTAPGGSAANCRWKLIRASRTLGIAETMEAPSPAFWVFRAGWPNFSGSSSSAAATAARDVTAAFDDQVVAGDLDLDAVDAEHGGGGLQAVGFLDAQLLQAAHDGRALGERGRHRQHQIFVDHRRCALRRHLDTAQFRS